MLVYRISYESRIYIDAQSIKKFPRRDVIRQLNMYASSPKASPPDLEYQGELENFKPREKSPSCEKETFERRVSTSSLGQQDGENVLLRVDVLNVRPEDSDGDPLNRISSSAWAAAGWRLDESQRPRTAQCAFTRATRETSFLWDGPGNGRIHRVSRK